MAIPNVLTIGGADCSGMTGIFADLRTFAALRCHGMAVTTLVGAQTTRAITAVDFLPLDSIGAQIRAVFDDGAIRAVKTGALGTADIIRHVAETLAGMPPVPLIVDPFCVARGGDVLLEAEARDALLTELAPRAAVLTPNLLEAALLTGLDPAGTLGEMQMQGRQLAEGGPDHVLVTGGHGTAASATDILISDGRPDLRLGAERATTQNIRGLSDTLTAAIAAHVAHDMAVFEAIQLAKLFVSSALGGADQLAVGEGPGPVNQMARLWERATGDGESG